ncbi:MAG: formate/nitrite transporter family protein [Acidobacteriaceae bacterium]
MPNPDVAEQIDPQLSPDERQEVAELSRATAIVLHEVIRREGETELRRSVSALAFSGLAAGLSMGLSLIGEGLIAAALPESRWRILVEKLGYPLGFLFIILGRQQLFTENTLTAVLPLLRNKDMGTFWRLLRLWGIVLVCNLVGTLAISFVLAHTSAFPEEAKREFTKIGLAAIQSPFWTEVVKAIFAAWMIAFMVWMLPSVENSRIAIVAIVTYFVGLGNMAHIVAGSVVCFYAAFAGATTFATCTVKFLIPTLIGNIIGGVTLVSALNHAQVDADLQGAD